MPGNIKISRVIFSYTRIVSKKSVFSLYVNCIQFPLSTEFRLVSHDRYRLVKFNLSHLWSTISITESTKTVFFTNFIRSVYPQILKSWVASLIFFPIFAIIVFEITVIVCNLFPTLNVLGGDVNLFAIFIYNGDCIWFIRMICKSGIIKTKCI